MKEVLNTKVLQKYQTSAKHTKAGEVDTRIGSGAGVGLALKAGGHLALRSQDRRSTWVVTPL
jgi:hypothetical protein